MEKKLCKNCEKNNIVHEFQDSQYGKFIRVHNSTDKKDGSKCTVCGSLNK